MLPVVRNVPSRLYHRPFEWQQLSPLFPGPHSLLPAPSGKKNPPYKPSSRIAWRPLRCHPASRTVDFRNWRNTRIHSEYKYTPRGLVTFLFLWGTHFTGTLPKVATHRRRNFAASQNVTANRERVPSTPGRPRPPSQQKTSNGGFWSESPRKECEQRILNK